MTDSTTILDMCCGSRMFWFNKQDTRAVFTDIRAEEHELCDGRRLVISPDLIADFRSLPFADSSFPVVVFDPPHLERVGQSAWMGKKYGRLNKKRGVLIYEADSKRLFAYCGHTAFSYSNGTRRRSLLARFWHLQM
ncbi:DNA cytosine methyltransferase [Escherichia coli DEC6A]|nr:DNA cytosine methyltransferase [Escherichia coli DEC6A]